MEKGKHKLSADYVCQAFTRCFLRLSHSFMRWAIYSCFNVSKARLRELYVSSSSLTFFWYQFSSVKSNSLRPCGRKASLSITNSWSLLNLMSIKSVMPSNHLILCCPLLLPPAIFPSIKVFSNESVHIRWPKYWSFSFSISPSNKYSGLIFFRMDWLDLLAVQGTLKSLLQHHSSKASILRHSAFFIVQLSHPYTTTGHHRFYGITVLLFSSG